MTRAEMSGRDRLHLWLAATATLLAAADTYVVVLALPDMMTSVGLDVTELQKAAPIVSAFLLGYVASLPLIGRLSDLYGRVVTIVGCLVVFAVGSLLTAAAPDLTVVVIGRFLQGAGGGGLVPATLALVAQLYPPERRGVPLGAVGAVQEVGAVLGPLFGAAILAVSDWRAIFWVNLAFGALLCAVFVATNENKARDWPGLALAAGALGLLALALIAPDRLTSDVRWGEYFLPVTGTSRLLTPVALAAWTLLAALIVREVVADRPIVNLRKLPDTAHRADLLGALLLGVALGGVVLSFATADPEQALVSPAWPVLLSVSAAAVVLFVWRQRRTPHPLVPSATVRSTPAWGSLLVSLFVGAALIAAIVDVPLFVRIVESGATQLDAAMVLLRFLVAVPVGALAGGWLAKHAPSGLLTGAAMGLAGLAFVLMAHWDASSLDGVGSTLTLLTGGFGFGLAIAPVNAALLHATPHDVHGIASALVVAARMIGMLVGISALTAFGLRRYYEVLADVPPPNELCPDNPFRCPEYNDRLLGLAIDQLHAVFWGAAFCALVAALLGLALLPRRRVGALGVEVGKE